MAEKKNIYESMAAVMADVGAIQKNQKNPQQGFLYRSIDAVYNALQPALIKNKVFVLPEILEIFREDRTTARGATLIFTRLTVKYTFYAEDGSFVTSVVVGEGQDSADKSSNKAMSAAFKYACFQAFCIPTEEMIDADAETPEESRKATPEHNTARTQQRPQNQARPPQTVNNQKKQQKAIQAPQDVTEGTAKRDMIFFINSVGMSHDNVAAVCKAYGAESLEALTEDQARDYMERVKRHQERKAQAQAAQEASTTAAQAREVVV